MNFASIHHLSVVFCVQNNLYTQSVPLRLESSVADLSTRAAGYGMPGVSVDGMDLLAVYPAVPPERVHVIRNGIDTAEYAPDPATDVIERYGIDPSQPRW